MTDTPGQNLKLQNENSTDTASVTTGSNGQSQGLEDNKSAVRSLVIEPLVSDVPVIVENPVSQSKTMSAEELILTNTKADPLRKKVKDFDWIGYKLDLKEVNYLKDFLSHHKSDKLNSKVLGLEESTNVEKDTSTNAAASSVNENLGKRNPQNQNGAGPNSFLQLPGGNAGTKKLMDVASSLEERLIKYGRLGEDASMIKRKVHNNNDFYEQDEFIDDPDDPHIPLSMEIPASRFEDFFALKGGLESLKKHKKFTERIGEVKLRNRESKTKRNEESKKKREEVLIQSLKKEGTKGTVKTTAAVGNTIG